MPTNKPDCHIRSHALICHLTSEVGSPITGVYQNHIQLTSRLSDLSSNTCIRDEIQPHLPRADLTIFQYGPQFSIIARMHALPPDPTRLPASPPYASSLVRRTLIDAMYRFSAGLYDASERCGPI
jgi:hypothetical protein